MLILSDLKKKRIYYSRGWSGPGLDRTVFYWDPLWSFTSWSKQLQKTPQESNCCFQLNPRGHRDLQRDDTAAVCVCVWEREWFTNGVITSDSYLGSVRLVISECASCLTDLITLWVSLLQSDQETRRFSFDIRRLKREVRHIFCVKQCSSAACCRSHPGVLGPWWLCCRG